MVGKKVKRTIFHVTQILYETQTYVHNKVLLKHNHADLFMFYLWLVSHYSGRTEKLGQKLYGPQSLKYLPSCPLQYKLC